MFDLINLTQSGHALGCELAYVFATSQIVVYSYSFIKVAGTIVLFKNFKNIFSGIDFSNCRDPTRINMVYSGLINNEFLQYHSATKRRSVSS